MANDTISRRAAIKAICEHGTELERRGITVLAVANHKQVTVDLLENLPSAERRGRWVYDEWIGWCCSECGNQAPFWCISAAQNLTDYCPNCGARMEEDE